MSDQIQKKVFEYIDAIAQKLGVATEYIYKALYKQMIIQGILDAALSLVFIFAILLVLKFFYKNFKDEQKLNEDKSWSSTREFWHFMFGFGSFLGGIGIVVCVCVFFGSLNQLMNPDYYVVKSILDAFK